MNSQVLSNAIGELPASKDCASNAKLLDIILVLITQVECLEIRMKSMVLQNKFKEEHGFNRPHLPMPAPTVHKIGGSGDGS